MIYRNVCFSSGSLYCVFVIAIANGTIPGCCGQEGENDDPEDLYYKKQSGAGVGEGSGLEDRAKKGFDFYSKGCKKRLKPP